MANRFDPTYEQMGWMKRESEEIARTARFYPHLLEPNTPPEKTSDDSSECKNGKPHEMVYQGFSETIGHYYRCSRCHKRS